MPDKRKEYGPWVRKYAIHHVLLNGTRVWFGFYYVRRVTVHVNLGTQDLSYEIIQEAANIFDMLKYPEQ